MRRLAINLLAAMSILPIHGYTGEKQDDEGGIVGTGRSSGLERPEITSRPDIPEHIERHDIELGDHQNLPDVNSAAGHTQPPIDVDYGNTSGP